MTISELMEEIGKEFKEELCEMLDYEMEINEKKIKGIPLSEDEFIFDTYMVKPSTIIKTIIKRNKDDK